MISDWLTYLFLIGSHHTAAGHTCIVADSDIPVMENNVHDSVHETHIHDHIISRSHDHLDISRSHDHLDISRSHDHLDHMDGHHTIPQHPLPPAPPSCDHALYSTVNNKPQRNVKETPI